MCMCVCIYIYIVSSWEDIKLAASTSGKQSWKKIRRRPAVTCTLTARAACTAARTMLSSCGHDAAWKSADKLAPASFVARGMLLAADAHAETSSMLPMRTTMPLVLVATFILPSFATLPVCVSYCYCARGVLTSTRKLLSL